MRFIHATVPVGVPAPAQPDGALPLCAGGREV